MSSSPTASHGSIALGPRLRIRLHEWQVEGRLTWRDFADVMADAVGDMDEAIAQAVEDLDFGTWWNGDVYATNARMAVYEALGGATSEPDTFDIPRNNRERLVAP